MNAIADAGPTPEEMLDVRQRLSAVHATLSRLHPRTRQILLMHRLEGLRYREIAERLGISESAVEKHVAKAALGLLRASKATVTMIGNIIERISQARLEREAARCAGHACTRTTALSASVIDSGNGCEQTRNMRLRSRN